MAVPSLGAWALSVAVSSLAAVALGIVVDRFETTRVFFVEDGPIEMLQAILLVAIAALFVIGFLRSSGSRAIFCLLAAYACVLAVTREVPRCGSAFVGGDICLPSSWKDSIALAASAVGLLGLVLRPVDWRSVLRLSNLAWTWPGLIVIGLLVGAELLEKLIYYSEIEEFLELVAYLHLGVMAAGIVKATARERMPAGRAHLTV